ncbi:MAG: endolytic transglycosylase MltG [Actinomycetota bacterium]|nr:endolytic transglycosylase MltG [Actinomycetota bacterium]
MELSTGSKAFLAVVVAVAVLVGGGLVVLDQAGTTSGTAQGRPISVEIPQGLGASGVADLLADEGVIGSPMVFTLVSRFDDRAARIKPGVYQLRAGMSTRELLGVLSTGPPRPATFRVTIPEGLTVDQTLERIANAPHSPFTVEQLEAALDRVQVPSWVPVQTLPADSEVFEGLLFPETYEFRVDSDAQDVLARLVAQTERVVAAVELPDGLDRYELLTLGSLIEREARVPDERPLISAVIHNRLAADMALQVDATVLYALGAHKERVLSKDTAVDSPWNTYEILGLPPTPISGAGRAAIEAAANPAPEDYLYYVVSDPRTGAHAFARSLAEHNDNVRRYRQNR